MAIPPPSCPPSDDSPAGGYAEGWLPSRKKIGARNQTDKRRRAGSYHAGKRGRVMQSHSGLRASLTIDLLSAIAKPNNYDYSGGMAYSRDFRRKVLAVRNKEGLTIAEAAVRFDVGSASVVRWIKNVERKPQGYRRRKIDLEALRKDVIDYPDAYQHERAQRFGVAQNAIFFALKKLQLTYKKNASAPQGGRRRTVHLPR